MSNYPDALDSFRELENVPGLEYEPTDKYTIFKEDILAIQSAIIAIQTILGLNPQGEYETVAARLDAGGGTPVTNYLKASDNYVLCDTIGNKLKYKG